MSILNYNRIIDNSLEVELYQGIGVSLKDNSIAFSNKLYFERLIKDSGYKSISVVETILNILEDKTIIKKLSFSEDRVIVLNNENNFIYLSLKIYNNLKKIIEFIEDNFKIKSIRGDWKEFTYFEIIIEKKNCEYILQVNPIKSWAYLYYAYSKEDKLLYPEVICKCDDLSNDLVYDSITEMISEDYNPSMIIDSLMIDIKEVEILLSSAGLIKWNGRRHLYIPSTDNEEVLQFLENNLSIINKRYTTEDFLDNSLKFRYESLNKMISKIYREMVDKEDQRFPVCDYLWTAYRQLIQKTL